MRGNIHCQIEGLYHSVAKAAGVSRHALKTSGSTTRHHLVHSDNTSITYRCAWHSLAGYAAGHCGVSRIEDITPDIAHEWLAEKIACGLAPQTIATYCAAITKFGRAIDFLMERSKKHGKV